MDKNIFPRVKTWSDTRGISLQKPILNLNWQLIDDRLCVIHQVMQDDDISGYVLNKLEELQEYSEANLDGMVNDRIDAIADSVVFDMTEMLKEGLDPKLVMDEVLKVIESRTGSWDEGLGKFVKDKSTVARSKWYKPDYINNCKLPIERTGCLFVEGFEDEQDGRNG